MTRAKCIARDIVNGIVDNDITVGKFYDVHGMEQVMGNPEPYILIVGDTGVEISRPRRLFKIFRKEGQRWREKNLTSP